MAFEMGGVWKIFGDDIYIYHGNLRYPPQGHPSPGNKALLIKGNQWLIVP